MAGSGSTENPTTEEVWKVEDREEEHLVYPTAVSEGDQCVLYSLERCCQTLKRAEWQIIG